MREWNRWSFPPEWAFDSEGKFDTSKILSGNFSKWYKKAAKTDRDKQYLSNHDKDHNI
jgi:hypothetical protein